MTSDRALQELLSQKGAHARGWKAHCECFRDQTTHLPGLMEETVEEVAKLLAGTLAVAMLRYVHLGGKEGKYGLWVGGRVEGVRYVVLDVGCCKCE